jgi:hypothetical protein
MRAVLFAGLMRAVLFAGCFLKLGAAVTTAVPFAACDGNTLGTGVRSAAGVADIGTVVGPSVSGRRVGFAVGTAEGGASEGANEGQSVENQAAVVGARDGT